MGDDDDRGAPVIELSQDAHDLLAISGIEIPGRLIG
jgi:hypothetical protein